MRGIQPGEQIFVSYTGDNNIADTWEEIFKCKCYCSVCRGTCVNSEQQSTSEKTQETGRESQHGIVDSVKDGPGRTQQQIMQSTATTRDMVIDDTPSHQQRPQDQTPFHQPSSQDQTHKRARPQPPASPIHTSPKERAALVEYQYYVKDKDCNP